VTAREEAIAAVEAAKLAAAERADEAQGTAARLAAVRGELTEAAKITRHSSDPAEVAQAAARAAQLRTEADALLALHRRQVDAGDRAQAAIAAAEEGLRELRERAQATAKTIAELEEEAYEVRRAWEDAQRRLPATIADLERRLERARLRYADLSGEPYEARERRLSRRRREEFLSTARGEHASPVRPAAPPEARQAIAEGQRERLRAGFRALKHLVGR
jgi:chromosome segregation ATPase